MYDKAIIDTLRTAERPLRMRDIVTRLAPDDTGLRAFSAIGMTLTKLTRAGHVQREKTDGRYWHYRLGAGGDEVAQLRAQLARAETVLSLLIESTCGGEVITPSDALKDAKPLTWYESAGEVSTMVVYGETE